MNSTDKPLKCDHCSYSTARKADLAKHRTKHTGEKPFACDECSYSTARKRDLLMHQMKHTGEKPFKCGQCSYSSPRKNNLIIHERKHTGEKPFACDQCSYSTVRNIDLVRHQRKHTGEKPYKCGECSYSSAQKSDLVKHERRHTGEKPYVCNQCSYSSAQKSDLIRHNRKHTGKKSFKQCPYSGTLKKYFIVQQSRTKKNYKCSRCYFKTSKKVIMLRHSRSHSGEKKLKFRRSCGDLGKPNSNSHERQSLHRISLRRQVVSARFRERLIKGILPRILEEEIAFHAQNSNSVNAIKSDDDKIDHRGVNEEVVDTNQVGHLGVDEVDLLVPECLLFVEERELVGCHDVEELKQKETTEKLEPPDDD